MTAADAGTPTFNETLAKKILEKFPAAELKWTSNPKHGDEDVFEVRSTSLLEITRETESLLRYSVRSDAALRGTEHGRSYGPRGWPARRPCRALRSGPGDGFGPTKVRRTRTRR